jgi:hypothetical protein
MGKSRKVAFLHVELLKNPILKLFHDSECDVNKEIK